MQFWPKYFWFYRKVSDLYRNFWDFDQNFRDFYINVWDFYWNIWDFDQKVRDFDTKTIQISGTKCSRFRPNCQRLRLILDKFSDKRHKKLTQISLLIHRFSLVNSFVKSKGKLSVKFCRNQNWLLVIQNLLPDAQHRRPEA